MKWVIRILQGLLVVGFAAFGVMKLTGNAMQVQTFEGFGYPLAFMYFIGFCEVLGSYWTIGWILEIKNCFTGFWWTRITNGWCCVFTF